ncbi:sugar transferase [Bacillus sp. AGMB 02131]|uniref:Sugar transferase n=1 Tax=Peribacillus faecalis TaxID=2772559 RepID=A0A927H9H8_9BACI|nr:sugar transferase [Peribacillus faecalis]MBD3107615.1 sugar transferase [Peribacillus faecalis]
MKRRIYSIETIEPAHFHAGSKARDDMNHFFSEMGIPKIVFDRSVSKLEKLLFMNSNVKRKLSNLNKDDIVIIQYPIYGKSSFASVLYKTIKQKGLSSILVVHDIDSIRNKADKKVIAEEVKTLNQFDIIISHNEEMTSFLKEIGVKRNIIDLEIFDYHNHSAFQETNNNGIVFAGNLQKSEFLSEISNMNNELILYGPNPQTYKAKNIRYIGAFPPNELPNRMNGKFGLIWDGTSVDTCSGLFGEYMKYNNPHKTSLYLSCGLPVIIWKEAALAKFIEKHNLGIAINSLENIDHELSKVTEKQYSTMKNNVISMAGKIRNGHFCKTSINRAVNLLMEEMK